MPADVRSWRGCFISIAALDGHRAGRRGRPGPRRRPRVKPGQQVAAAVWYNAKEEAWHFWTTSPAVKGGKSPRVVFTGSVRVIGDEVAGEFDKLERDEAGRGRRLHHRAHRDKRGFDFRFATAGGTDGVKFQAGAKAQSVRFKLLAGGVANPASRVVIGRKQGAPRRRRSSPSPLTRGSEGGLTRRSEIRRRPGDSPGRFAFPVQTSSAVLPQNGQSSAK